ncbi:MAG: transcriptional regulator, partial [Acidobacteriota bacterium]
MRSRSFLSFLLLVITMCHIHGNPEISYLGPYGGDVRSLAIHPGQPDRLFLGTADGQIFISLDRGETWSRSAGLKRRQLVLDSIVF